MKSLIIAVVSDESRTHNLSRYKSQVIHLGVSPKLLWENGEGVKIWTVKGCRVFEHK
jgi:hypothetical protein